MSGRPHDGAGRPRGFASARTARHYDAQRPLERAALRAAATLVAPSRSDRALDLATGTGAMLEALAATPSAPGSVLGIDASPAMLELVGALPAGWSVREGDARAVPAADASVDLVTCAYLLHLLGPDGRHAVLAEIARVLAPGGRAVLVTLLEPRGLAGRGVLAPLQAGLCALLGRASGWCAHDPTDELAAVGLRPRAARVSRRGYASLCLLAVPV